MVEKKEGRQVLGGKRVEGEERRRKVWEEERGEEGGQGGEGYS